MAPFMNEAKSNTHKLSGQQIDHEIKPVVMTIPIMSFYCLRVRSSLLRKEMWSSSPMVQHANDKRKVKEIDYCNPCRLELAIRFSKYRIVSIVLDLHQKKHYGYTSLELQR